MGDFRSVFQVVRKWLPRELYNLSGQSSVALSFDQPVETFNSIVNGSVNLLEAIRFTGEPIRYYNASSSECFGNVEGGFADESTPFRPRSPYAAAKAAAHWQVANYREGYKLFACNGVLFNHESPLRPERFVTRKITRAVHRIARGSSERLKLGNLTVRRDWGWAPEYVDAMWRMLQQEKPDDYVVATGETHSVREFVEAAFGHVG
jgi:GDPmannose 4,6-dehydratase